MCVCVCVLAVWGVIQQVIRAFVDEPVQPFSLHKVVNGGKRLGKDPGQWFGPSTVAQVLGELSNDACQRGMHLRLAVCQDSLVIVDKEAARCVSTGSSAPERSAPSDGDAKHEEAGTNWSHSLLLVIPLRLGLGRTIDAAYIPGAATVARACLFNCCVSALTKCTHRFAQAVSIEAKCGLHRRHSSSFTVFCWLSWSVVVWVVWVVWMFPHFLCGRLTLTVSCPGKTVVYLDPHTVQDYVPAELVDTVAVRHIRGIVVCVQAALM